MCNEREIQVSEKRRDWLAGGLWALLPVGLLALAAGLAFLLFLAFTWAIPWRWAEWLAEAMPEGLQLGILVLVCLAAWWLVFTVDHYRLEEFTLKGKTDVTD